jgi:CII-binding regulator of phage lambda lysogenization HflD
MASKDFLNYKISSLRNEVPKVKKKLSVAKQAVEALDAEVDALGLKVENVASVVEAFEAGLTKKYERVIAKLQEKVDALEKQLSKGGVGVTNETVISKVTTIAIFDAILSAITSWSVHGDQASDVEAASQTVIFPCVYERVMSGDDPAYLLDEVPSSAELVVQRGREFVKWIRSECETHITNEAAWEKYAPKIQEWWLNDGLPLLYGESDPDWEEDTLFTLEQIEVWRNNPVDRMMAFPKIHDAMDLLQKHRSEVNSRINLQEFNRNVAATRLS